VKCWSSRGSAIAIVAIIVIRSRPRLNSRACSCTLAPLPMPVHSRSSDHHPRDYPGSLTMNRQLAARDERDRDQTRVMFPNSRQPANKSYTSSASRDRGATRFQLKWRNLWPCDYFGIAFERRPRAARMQASEQTLRNSVQFRANAKILRLYKGDLGKTLVISEWFVLLLLKFVTWILGVITERTRHN
jgi:hypothetical protein